MQLIVRAGEKLYLNGAVIRVDRKVSIELMNDATFLLEAHVMTLEQTTTPLRQLYFTIQIILMDPACNASPQADSMLNRLLETFDNEEIKAGLHQIRDLLVAGRCFEALKTIRGLFAVEAQIFAPPAPPRIALSA